MDEQQTQLLDWAQITRALVIVAHPDDADIICGGTCIEMARRGIQVTYMVLTNGDKGNHNPEITRNQLIAMRQIEQRAAAARSGVHEVLFMGEEDGFLRPRKAIRKRVTREIRRIRPELIICTNPDRYFVGDSYINHPDHRNAGLVAIEAIFPAADNPMFYPDMADEGYHPHKIKYLLVHGHDKPDLKVDITEHIDVKIEAVLCHVSQFSDPAGAQKRWRETWGEAQEDGGVRYFEAYKVMKFG
jgi:LmbE family N-acetylglucosaminyl deacetylase